MSRPDSIRSIGLKKYLNQNAVNHGGLGYDVFARMVDQDVSISAMAETFGRTRFTILKWISIYREERSRERPNSEITKKS